LHSQILRRVAALAAFSLLSGCGLGHQLFGIGGTEQDASLGQSAAMPAVFGYAVADEPQAALVARQILNEGGNAADAAAAEGFALSVTLPSRAGIGGGGACIVKMPATDGSAQPPVALIFAAGAPSTSANASRPAAVPTLARGLLALQARYGQLPFASVIVPAERLASGVPVSPALESDLQIVGNALLADPAAAAVFGPSGTILPVGANLVQPDLAATFENLRTQGVQGFYAGAFAQQFADAATTAGGGLTVQDLSEARPQFTAPDISNTGNLVTAALPNATPTSQTQPASASFMALDKNGGIVACAVSMNNLFGTGRIAPGTGILLAASPRTTPAATLKASVTYNQNLNFRSANTGTGDSAISRANTIACPNGVPGGEASCTASADPHGQGLAIGGR
jgi:gamma-glutamyltranspeptidase / glutathione hydrolase